MDSKESFEETNQLPDGYVVLMQYFAIRKLGIRLLGVLITYKFVILTMLRVCVYLPITLILLRNVMFGLVSGQ